MNGAPVHLTVGKVAGRIAIQMLGIGDMAIGAMMASLHRGSTPTYIAGRTVVAIPMAVTSLQLGRPAIKVAPSAGAP